MNKATSDNNNMCDNSSMHPERKINLYTGSIMEKPTKD